MSRLVVVSDPQCGLTSVFKSAVSQGELDVLLLEHGQITALSHPNIAFTKLSQGNTVYGDCKAGFTQI